MSELVLLATRACIEGAAMNVRINLAGLKDEKVKASSRRKGCRELSRRIRSASSTKSRNTVETSCRQLVMNRRFFTLRSW